MGQTRHECGFTPTTRPYDFHLVFVLSLHETNQPAIRLETRLHCNRADTLGELVATSVLDHIQYYKSKKHELVPTTRGDVKASHMVKLLEDFKPHWASIRPVGDTARGSVSPLAHRPSVMPGERLSTIVFTQPISSAPSTGASRSSAGPTPDSLNLIADQVVVVWGTLTNLPSGLPAQSTIAHDETNPQMQ